MTPCSHVCCDSPRAPGHVHTVAAEECRGCARMGDLVLSGIRSDRAARDAIRALPEATDEWGMRTV